MTPIIISALVYIIVMPIIFRLVALAHKKLVTERKIAKLNLKPGAKGAPRPIWGTWKKRISFTFTDKRDFSFGKKDKKKEPTGESASIQNRFVFFALWALGLAGFVLGTVLGMWQLYVAGVVVFFISVGFAITASKDVLETRKKVLNRMFEIGTTAMGLSFENSETPENVINVLEWIDYIKPNKVTYAVPTAFSSESEERFLRLFNQIFGTETAWVPFDDPETERPGWDYENALLTLRAVPPLPQRADWSAHYVINDDVAWSFFPVAKGVDHGIELLNPHTNEVENVIGFDLADLQKEKKNVKKSPHIALSPMGLVAGGTGSGKAMDVDTPVLVVRHDSRYDDVSTFVDTVAD